MSFKNVMMNDCGDKLYNKYDKNNDIKMMNKLK